MSNLSTLPKGDSAWLLRKAIERIIQQVSVLETNIGASTTGNSANTQVIFNDNGTLRGDPDLIFNTALNKLVATNLESTTALTVGGSATITGDLTVDTSTLKVDSTNNRVGIGTASPSVQLHLAGTDTTNVLFAGVTKGIRFVQSASTSLITGVDNTGAASYQPLSIGGSALDFSLSGTTAMTLNSTGLGIGVAPVTDCKLTVRGGSIFDRGVGGGSPQLLLSLAASSGGNYGQISNTGTRWALGFGGTLTTVGTEALVWDSSANVGIGVTPSASWVTYKALEFDTGIVSGSSSVALNRNCYFDGVNWRYKVLTSFGISQYQLSGNGSHIWNIASSGSAGALINGSGAWTDSMTLDASGNLLVGVTSANANGGVLQLKSGITFPATQVAASDANTLDDYEEGTWTPVATGLTNVGAVTYIATYTKIGRVVYINLKVTAVTSTTSVANTTFFSGLPFTPALNSTITAVNEGNITSLGVGLIATGSTVFTPNWTAVQNATISGFYYV